MTAAEEIVSKKEFAVQLGVSSQRVSQLVTSKKISGDALVGTGRKARIRVSIAVAQLRRTLDVDQHMSGNGKARLKAVGGAPAVQPPDGPPTIEDKIKTARLEQIALANDGEREARALRAGRYVLAEDARQEMGRVAGRLMTLFEASLSEFANAMVAAPPALPREALRTLRATWKAIRARASEAETLAAATLPATIEDEAA